MNLVIEMPSGEALNKDANLTLEMVQAFVITSPAMYDMAAEELKEISAKLKLLEDQRMGITRPMDEAKKKVMDLYRTPIDVLTKSVSMLKGGMLAFQQEQRRIAAEAQAKLNAEAEAQRKRQREEAEAAAAVGNIEQAAALSIAAAVATAPVIKSEAPKVSGISTRESWKAEVSNKAEYLKHVLANPELLGTVQIDMKPLNQMAKALKQNLNLPGIKSVCEESIAARRS